MKIFNKFITEVKSHSHKLDKSAFSVMMSEQSLVRVSDVTQDSFKAEVIMTEDLKKTTTDYFGYAFMVSSSFLVAINIAALGHFTWSIGNRMFWHCEHVGPSGKVEQAFMKSNNLIFPIEKREITDNEVRNSMIILGSLLHENDQNYRKEYLKGIIHLNAGFGDLTFSREAFANFYRSFEYFITVRVLKKKKLENELNDLKKAIRSLGLSDKFCEEFTNLYKIRSEQVMHAQKVPKDMNIDDVLKIKIFTDYVLHKYYRSEANQWLSKQIQA